MNTRTIESVLNIEDGSEISADSFFQKSEKELFNYRRELQEAIKGIRQPLFVCYFCGQLVKLNGGGYSKKVLHFAHQKDSDFCDIKTNTKYTFAEINRIKYNGAKESHQHLETKKIISNLLEQNKDFSNIQVEKALKSKNNLEWKKPDISADYKGIKIVFEIQLSTTFLSVIVDREYFYKVNQTHILWIFRNFEIEEFKQRFTDKDVFYSNNRNAFVLDDEAIKLSEMNNDLYLLCYYQKPLIHDLDITYLWESKYVCFDELTFDTTDYKIFYYDVEKTENECKNKLAIKKIQAEASWKLAEFEDKLKLNNQLESTDWEKKNRSRGEIIGDEKTVKFQENNFDFYLRTRQGYYHLSHLQNTLLLPITQMPDSLYSLFANGYEASPRDRDFVNREFKKELQKENYVRYFEIIDYLAITTFYIRLKGKKNLMFRLPKVQYVLFGILSFKVNKVIGYQFQNLKGVFNHIVNKQEHGWIFLNAVEVHYGLNQFLSEDEKGTFTAQLIRFRDQKPLQNNEHDEIITAIFPSIMKDENYVMEFLESL